MTRTGCETLLQFGDQTLRTGMAPDTVCTCCLNMFEAVERFLAAVVAASHDQAPPLLCQWCAFLMFLHGQSGSRQMQADPTC